MVFVTTGEQGNQWLLGHADLNPGKFRLVIEGTLTGGSRGDIAVDEPSIHARSCMEITEASWEDGAQSLLEMVQNATDGYIPDDIGHFPGYGNYSIKEWVCMGGGKMDEGDEKEMEMEMDEDVMKLKEMICKPMDDMNGRMRERMDKEMGRGMDGGMEGGMDGGMGGETDSGMGGGMDNDMGGGMNNGMGGGMSNGTRGGMGKCSADGDMMPEVLMFPLDYMTMSHHLMAQKKMLEFENLMLKLMHKDKMMLKEKCMKLHWPTSKECWDRDLTG